MPYIIPKISICALNSCSTLRIEEITRAYNVLNNLYGWGSPNASTADLLTAQLIITSPGGTITTIDVLSQIPVPYVEEFLFNDISITPEDGEWSIQYILTTASTTYSNISKIFLSCAVRCCIDKTWKKVLDKDLGCGCDYTSIDDLTKKVLFMESLYYSMNSAGSCNNSDARDKILKQLQRLCKIEKCNC